MNHSSLLRRQAPTAALAAGVLAITLFVHADPASLDLSITVAVFSLLAPSVAASYGQAGVLSVAQAAFAALGGYATAIATTRWDLPVLAGLAAAVAVPVLVAYPLARLVSRLSHLALAIATLVFGEIVVILLREGGDLTGSYIGISAIPSLPWAEDLFSYHLFAWAVVVAVTALYANLVRTSHGRSLQTIRYDVLRARADGVNVARRTAAVFSFSAGIAGVAGWLYAHHLKYLAPESLPSALSITAILMAVVGGSRYVLGPVVGTTVLVFVQNALPSEAAQGLLYGSALVVALLAAPDGLLGLARQAWTALRGRPRRRPPIPRPGRTPHPRTARPRGGDPMSLVARDVSIRFGGVAALSGVGVEVSAGAVQGVIGPNGSGKSTLFNCLTGFARPDSGHVSVDGTDLSRVPAHRRIGLGIARTFQTPRFDPRVTVWQAVACGFSPVASAGLLSSALWPPWVRARERRVGEGVARLLDRFGLAEERHAQIGELSLGHVRLVEVARAMAMSPRYLLLDEPAAGLGEGEQRLLADELRRLASEGVGVLIVEHNFDLVLDLCDRILVLSGGRVLLDDRPGTVAADERVRRIYLGYAADEDEEVPAS